LGAITSVGFCTFSMTCAIVNVLPVPVAPSSVSRSSPDAMPSASRSTAVGWSPDGSKSAWTLNGGTAPSYGSSATALRGMRGGIGCGVNALLDVEWDTASEWLRTNGVLIAVVLAVAVVFSRTSGRIVRRARDRLDHAENADQTSSLQRRATLSRVLTHAFRAVIWVTAVIAILLSVGVNLGPILTGAGLAALAVAFGTQHLIRDIVMGIFIVVENQYDVGDLVTLRIEGSDVEITGWVHSITFRATELEVSGGVTEFVSNGKVVASLNRSRGRGRLRLEVRVPSDIDAERIRDEVEDVLLRIKQDRRVAQTFYTGPNVDRHMSNGSEHLTISLETRPERRDEVEQALRRDLYRRLHAIDDRIEIEQPADASESS
jgi:small conductance mechanosensitive channel